jgi:nucleoside-diphosphate-sugar epimerase
MATTSILITGGAGFIGSSIAERLLAQGERVRILDDFSTGRRSNVESLRGHVEVVEGTITDPETVKRALEGVRVVFHQAAIPSVARSVANPVATMNAGVLGTTVMLDGARHAGVKRFVFAASSSAYGDTPTLPKVETMEPRPLSPYAVSKLTGEHLVRVCARLYGLEAVSLRYFNVFGPRQDPKSDYAAVIPAFVSAVLRNVPPTINGDGEQTRDFCFIDNTVDANLLAATTSKRLAGEVVNVACGDRTSLNQLFAHITDIARAQGLPGAALAPTHGPPRAGDVRDSLAAIDAARELLGYEPKVRIREGLERTFAALRAVL